MRGAGAERLATQLPLDLHVALARLDAHLGATRGAINDLMRCWNPRPPHGIGTVQYRALEDAIRERKSGAAQESSTLEATAAPNAMPLGTGRWFLCKDGWTLVLPDGSSLALRVDERSILLHIARSPEHRISDEELDRLLGLPSTQRQTRTESSEIHARVINRLRRRTRALGEGLPLRLIRGWGYQLARSHLPSSRRSLGADVASRVPDAPAVPKHEEAEMGR